MKKPKPKIIEVIRPTTLGFHSWVKARVKGEEIIIRKENKNIPDKLFKNE